MMIEEVVKRCGKPVLLKRGIRATVQELLSAEYVLAEGNHRVQHAEEPRRVRFVRRSRCFFPARAQDTRARASLVTGDQAT